MSIPLELSLVAYRDDPGPQLQITVSRVEFGPVTASWDDPDGVTTDGTAVTLTVGEWGGEGAVFGSVVDSAKNHNTLSVVLSEPLPDGVWLGVSVSAYTVNRYWSLYFDPGGVTAEVGIDWPLPPPFGVEAIGGDPVYSHRFRGPVPPVEFNGNVYVAGQTGLYVLPPTGWAKIYTLPPPGAPYYELRLAATDSYVFLSAYDYHDNTTYFLRAASPVSVDTLSWPNSDLYLISGTHPSWVYRSGYVHSNEVYQRSSDGVTWDTVSVPPGTPYVSEMSVAYVGGVTFISGALHSTDGLNFVLSGDQFWENQGVVRHSNVLNETLLSIDGEGGFETRRWTGAGWEQVQRDGGEVRYLCDAFGVALWSGQELWDMFTTTTLDLSDANYYPEGAIDFPYDGDFFELFNLADGVMFEYPAPLTGDIRTHEYYWLTNKNAPPPETPPFWRNLVGTREIP